MGRLGLSASHVNLRVARYLAGFLRDAGAVVLLTRESEEVRTPEDIARMTNRFRADRYIEIRHPALPEDSVLATRVYHFPGSSAGARMAADLSAALARRLPHPARQPGSRVTYPLQQTACPAVVVDLPSIADRDEELRLDSSRYLREQAYGTFLGILDHFAAPDTSVLAVRLETPGADGWLVTLDDTWSLIPGSGGRVVFERIAAGAHSLRASRGRRSVTASCTIEGDSASVRVVP
jgi:N-acetylmuramoyl-L-alanine amidase